MFWLDLHLLHLAGTLQRKLRAVLFHDKMRPSFQNIQRSDAVGHEYGLLHCLDLTPSYQVSLPL